AEGVVASAFGFQGQKCSACSRTIAHERIYDDLLERVVARASLIMVGDPVDGGNSMGAVIESEAEARILDYIEIGKGEGRLALGGGRPESVGSEGYFIAPAI